MTDAEELLRAAEDAIARATKEGATDAEAYVCAVDGLTLDQMGELQYAREIHESGLSLRITVGRRTASATASGSSERAIEKAVEEAMRRARAKPEAKELPAFAAPGPMGAPTRVDVRLTQLDEDALSADAQAITRLVSTRPDVTFHATSLWTYAHAFAIASTRGVAAWDHDAMQTLQVEARVTRRGISRTARETVAVDRPVREALDVDELANTVVDRAAFATDAKPLPKSVDEVIFTPYTMGQMLNLWLPSVAGPHEGPTAHARAKPIGARVASSALTIRDAPRSSGGPRHQRVDDEGTPTHDIALVDRGELRARMFHANAAAHAGVAPTGHGYRPLLGRWGAKLTTRPGNLRVEPGSKSLDELIAGMDRGVVLTDQLMGAFIANTGSGEFSFVAPTSYYVEKGSIVHALPSVTVGGDVHDVLTRVIAVGRDLRSMYHGTTPPVHASGVACAT